MSDSVYEKIKDTGRLPSPTGVALELMRLTGDEKSTIDQISSVVESDPAIASRLLQLVNSPLLATSRTVASVSMAVRLLGMHLTKNVALTCTLLNSHRSGASSVFDYDRYWAESLARGAAARTLAGDFGGFAPDEVFAVALLSKIGRLALATVYSKGYDDVLQDTEGGSTIDVIEAERRTFEIDHNELTARMMADWRLADMFCASVRLQDSMDELQPDDGSRVAKFARLLHMSGQIASLLSRPDVYREDLTELLQSAERSGLEVGRFHTHFEAIKEQYATIASILSVDICDSPSLREAHTRASRSHRNILVVDDDPDMCRLLERYLSDAGYEVRTASNGMEALQVIRTSGCQLLVTDRNMPLMDGFELCRSIREAEGIGFVYTLILTADTKLASLSEAFDAGADDYLIKPFQAEELLSRLKAGVRTLDLEADLAKQRLELHKTNAEMAVLNNKLQELATTDELTGLHNRREALLRMEECWRAAERDGSCLACMVVDIDHFKKCNDDHGHDFGDEVLRQTARMLAHKIRKNEMVFRVGGEEFLILCPGATAEQAAIGAERLRSAVEADRIYRKNVTLSVTISVGVAERSNETTKPLDLLQHADAALYNAKRNGRNRVCMHKTNNPAPGPADPVKKEYLPTTSVFAPRAVKDTPGVVLAADDDADIRRLVSSLLRPDGYTIHTACDGVEALELASQILPDVILLDVDMPRMDGLECTRRLKSDISLRDTPIIILSGRSERKQVLAGLEAGAQEYVIKPIVRDEFLLRVRAMNQLRSGKEKLQQSNAVRGEQARVMCILLDLSQGLAMADSLDDIVAHTVASSAELLNCRSVTVLLPNETRDLLHVAGAVGLEDDLADSICVPVGRNIVGTVFASGSTLLVNSERDKIAAADRYQSQLLTNAPLVSKPLSVPNKVIGVLCATDRHGGQPFEPHEIEYLDLICNMAASSLEQIESAMARERAHAAIVIGLAKLAEHRDADTGRHLERVTKYALMLAEELRTTKQYESVIDAEFLLSLERAMPLHDIGKVSVPDSVLLKAGPLTEAEFTIMKHHAEVGAAAIQSVIEQAPEASFLTMARDIAHCHHEHVDGNGYPRQLTLTEIPIAARIAAVADVYDALTTRRPYKEAFPHAEASNLIRQLSGKQFDSDVVNAFHRIEDEIILVASSLRDDEDCLANEIDVIKPALSSV